MCVVFFLMFFSTPKMNGILTKLYPKNGSKWIFPQILLPSLQTIPKAGASACEKGGRWLLSLELLREAKV